jgi:DNA-binding CsgD family transcriptional regulator
VAVVEAGMSAASVTQIRRSVERVVSAGDDVGPVGPLPWARRAAAETGWPWAFALPAGLFLIITFFVGADMAADLTDGVGPAHLVLETIAFLLCLAGTGGTALQLRTALRRGHDLQRDLEGTRADLEGTRADLVRWRDEAKDLLGGLRGAIDLQFQRWELTSAQCEVALLVLKGFSYKEIADLRETTERTVRNQALAIYRKAGLASRAEMAAFFLEDFLVPTERWGRERRPTEPNAARAEPG